MAQNRSSSENTYIVNRYNDNESINTGPEPRNLHGLCRLNNKFSKDSVLDTCGSGLSLRKTKRIMCTKSASGILKTESAFNLNTYKCNTRFRSNTRSSSIQFALDTFDTKRAHALANKSEDICVVGKECGTFGNDSGNRNGNSSGDSNNNDNGSNIDRDSVEFGIQKRHGPQMNELKRIVRPKKSELVIESHDSFMENENGIFSDTTCNTPILASPEKRIELVKTSTSSSNQSSLENYESESTVTEGSKNRARRVLKRIERRIGDNVCFGSSNNDEQITPAASAKTLNVGLVSKKVSFSEADSGKVDVNNGSHNEDYEAHGFSLNYYLLKDDNSEGQYRAKRHQNNAFSSRTATRLGKMETRSAIYVNKGKEREIIAARDSIKHLVRDDTDRCFSCSSTPRYSKKSSAYFETESASIDRSFDKHILCDGFSTLKNRESNDYVINKAYFKSRIHQELFKNSGFEQTIININNMEAVLTKTVGTDICGFVNKYYLEEELEGIYQTAEAYFFGTEKVEKNLEKSLTYFRFVSWGNLKYKVVQQAATELGFCYEFGIEVKCDFIKAELLYLPAADAGCSLAQLRIAFLRKYGRPGVKIDKLEAEKWADMVRGNKNSSATRWLKKAAEIHLLAPAQYALGLCYHDGIGVDVNEKKAFELYYKSAKQGNARGQGILGYCFGEGFGVNQNKEEAVKWYYLAAKQGESVAMYNLGYCYEDGIGIDKNPNLAVKWYKRAAERGNAFAQNSLGYCFEDGLGVDKDPSEAAKWYRLSALQGYPWAECNLGYCYQYGIGVQTDAKEAIYWYKRAAGQGHARAQHNLGYCYQNGIGVEKNEREAVLWYHKAAVQGNTYAYHSLGYCYQNGSGVEINLGEAVKWYNMAAQKNHPPALLSLGYCYRNGIGVEKNDEQAFRSFKASAESGNSLAQNSLGYCFEEGIGTDKNPRLAFHYYTLSAAQKNPWAICNVGYCLAHGVGVKKNLKKAVHFYGLAARMGHARAMEKLGLALLEGIGTSKNEQEAFMWFKAAAENHSHSPAMHWLGYCYEKGLGTLVDEDMAVYWYQKAIANGDSSAVERLRLIFFSKCAFSLSENTSKIFSIYSVAPAA
ncbi:hypothetical protein AX774_g673 [Zancudomyces culisetae]|uniref:Protein sel-1-like protein n=1 Tax=Zancudomyces culisetae TaxID=1213189 RepID=A0A1R1PXS9_ZANCU|nr:hypothetical protein AX774_g673 [Zancudomyces culisetae]|eukprot:OMH85760.1 hypothetical protein AX774_g673 [Zancudomyces culisetae]